MHAWQWVRKTYPDLLIFHVPSGEHRDIATAMKLKRMGVIPGVADFLMFIPGHGIAIEMKNEDGVQSKAQEYFQKQWEKLGHTYLIARSLNSFKEIINGYVNLAWPWVKQSKPTNQ
jgi:hypothetical protein